MLQKVIGLDYLAQLIAGARVSAVGVGMVNLDQLLEARLDFHPRRLAGEVQRLQALLLERFQLPAALGRLLAGGLGATREKGMRIEGAEGGRGGGLWGGLRGCGPRGC